MQQTMIRVSMVVLFFILFSSLAIGVTQFIDLNENIGENTAYETKETPVYHFMVIVDGSNPSYIEEFKKGMTEASLDYHVACEFWSISGANRIEEIQKQIDIAIQSGVDGIVVESFDHNEFVEAIQKANEENIPVVTINEDVIVSGRVSHVGISKFSIGSEIGKLLNNKIIGNGEVVVLQKSTDANIYDRSNQDDGLLVLGIKDTINDYTDLRIKEVKYSGENILNAEEITMRVLDENKNIKALVCTDGQDTLGVVQLLIDFNKISDIIVIGYDDLPEILDYIDTESEVIYATVIADYKKVGYNSIESLVQFKEEKFVSIYSDVEVTIVTKDNIEEYKLRLSEENEKDEYN